MPRTTSAKTVLLLIELTIYGFDLWESRDWFRLSEWMRESYFTETRCEFNLGSHRLEFELFPDIPRWATNDFYGLCSCLNLDELKLNDLGRTLNSYLAPNRINP